MTKMEKIPIQFGLRFFFLRTGLLLFLAGMICFELMFNA